MQEDSQSANGLKCEVNIFTIIAYLLFSLYFGYFQRQSVSWNLFNRLV